MNTKKNGSGSHAQVLGIYVIYPKIVIMRRVSNGTVSIYISAIQYTSLIESVI